MKMMFARKRPNRLDWSSETLWVRAAHWLRVGGELAVAFAAITALAWVPSSPTAPSAASAAVPPGPDLQAARAASAYETQMLAGVVGAALAGHVEKEARVRRGDTLRDVLAREGVPAHDFNPAILALSDVFDARYLRAGQSIRLFLTEGGDDVRLDGLAFEPETARTIHVARAADGSYRGRDFATPLTLRIARAHGAITESLYADAKRAGADDMVIAEIANLLAYTVDFQREIRVGDTFDILFEQYLDPSGEPVKTGALYYVEFTPRGRELAYWRYQPPGEEEVGFYDAAGESARRFLMKTPVNATRISSGFSRARRHPVLGYTRAHKGTDFAAPRGTPIYAAGNGVVERANRYGSFGNYVRIRHANGYQTIYGHLNGFARGMRAGAHVTQGQVIGYVGMTGTATGPHLHYEVHRNGVAVNPMTIDAPTGRTLDEGEISGFNVERVMIDALRARAPDAQAHPGEPEALFAGSDAEAEEHAALDAEAQSSEG